MGALANQARAYLDVPFVHRGRDRRGLDCAGLVWRCYADLGAVLPDLRRYGREPHRNGLVNAVNLALGEPLWAGAVGQLVRRTLLQVDDVLLIRFDLEPHHMAIVGDNHMHGVSMIHAYGQIGVSRVVEHGLDDDWQRKICAVYRRAV